MTTLEAPPETQNPPPVELNRPADEWVSSTSSTPFEDDERFTEYVAPVVARQLRERLLSRTMRPDGLDWEALAELDDAWGADSAD